MRKDYYFTNINYKEKTDEWKEILSNYYSSKKEIKFKIKNTALLVIDMQEYFLNPNSHAYLPSARTIITPIKKLADIFLKNNKLVIFTQWRLPKRNSNDNIMEKWWKRGIKDKDPMFVISPEFNTTKAKIIIKNTYDSFNGTNLLNILKNNKCTNLIITGVTTHLCCETTARNAFCNNLAVFLPIDCMATYTEEFHLNTLKAASHGFGIPTTSEEILEKFI